MELTHRTRGRPSTTTLWFALLGGMAAYAVHLVVGFWIVPGLCGLDRPGAVDALVAVATVAAAAVAVAAAVASVRSRRSLRELERRERPRPPPAAREDLGAAWDVSPTGSTAQFMATTGIWLNLLALAVVLLAGLPHLVVSPCV